MYKVARESKKNREVLFANTAEKKGIHPAFIEKDFWVCFLLELLFHQSEYVGISVLDSHFRGNDRRENGKGIYCL